MTKEFISKSSLKVGAKEYKFVSLEEAAKKVGKDISKLPYSLKILLENLVRNFDGDVVNEEHISCLIDSVKNPEKRIEIAYIPARVLMQDFTGVPAVVDLAAMRDAVAKQNKDPKKINPLVPVDLVIDHSVQVDFAGSTDAFKKNVDLEMERNNERYEFLKWAQKSFNNFRAVPPGTGICHQVNLENLAQVVWTKEENGETIAYPDTVVGTDSHTTMINGLAVLGWGVGGIEAEAAMLGQPISMLIPEVIGFKLTGKLQDGITATDLVLAVTQTLRKKGVVGKFVEFFGPALPYLSLADRATIANMAPEYGATCGIFPIDRETINYLNLTGRSLQTVELVEAYARAQKMFCENYDASPEFSEVLELDISSVVPSLAGPKRPQDRVTLSQVNESFEKLFAEVGGANDRTFIPEINSDLGDGDVAIAAITSCTNTSNPSVLIAAGLLARNAVAKGLKVKGFVKTSLAPGSQVVSEYLLQSGLQNYLDQLGFNVVGYGCTTCIGNSGPLHSKIEEVIKEKNTLVASVISGNRNFEGRVHPLVKANYLGSPPLVVAYALAGTVKINFDTDAIGVGSSGQKVLLKDIWPSKEEIDAVIAKNVTREIFEKKYSDLFKGDEAWQAISIEKSDTYKWNPNSTYIRLPNFFDDLNRANAVEIKGAKVLGLFGDSITTDHISPAGNISATSPAAVYLAEKGVQKVDFNSYGARRGNHEVMMRGTFANIRIKNEMLGGVKEGGFTKIFEKGDEVVSIYDAAMFYKEKNTSLVIFAGKEYGTGSSRDWAAKGTFLLGVKAVIAESFERIHRSNLIGMGVMPLIFKGSQNRKTLNLIGNETVDILGIDSYIKPKQDLRCIITRVDGSKEEVTLTCGLDTSNEVEYFRRGGILQYVMNQIC